MSLSPIELRKREKIYEKAFEPEKKTFKLEKNATSPVFSKKIPNMDNDFLYKIVDQELKQIGSPFSNRKPRISKVPSISPHNKLVFSLKPGGQETIKRSTRSISPLIRKTEKKGLALYSMNYKHVYDELRS